MKLLSTGIVFTGTRLSTSFIYMFYYILLLLISMFFLYFLVISDYVGFSCPFTGLSLVSFIQLIIYIHTRTIKGPEFKLTSIL